jgi:hypothetical protein
MTDTKKIERKKGCKTWIDKLKVKNKKLKTALKVSTKSNSHSTKGDIPNANNWTGKEANLADKITEFLQGLSVSLLQVLKDGWQTYNPENDKSFCYFVGKNMANNNNNFTSLP